MDNHQTFPFIHQTGIALCGVQRSKSFSRPLPAGPDEQGGKMQPKDRGKNSILQGVVAGVLMLAVLCAAPALMAQDRPPWAQQGGQGGGDKPGDANPPQQEPGVPAKLNVPVGTLLSVRTTSWLSTDRNKKGETFTAVLEQPLIIDGWVVAKRGQTILGQVTVSEKGGRIKGTSQLGVEITELTLVDGQQLPLHTQLLKVSAGTSHGQDAGTIVGTTALGAAIGAAADWGRGAAIGAGAGAAAGILGVLVTRGRPTVIPSESVLTFRTQEAETISTERSEFAFRPVTDEDYGRGGRGGGRYGRSGPGGYARPYSPYYGYYGYYPSYYYPGYFYPGPVFIGGFGFRGRRGFRSW
jgi:hypothetical protein